MDVEILKGEPKHLEDCYEALIKSDIGKVYFLSFDARKILLKGLENKEIDVAVDENDRCMGFVWCERRGAFGMHSYLHIIAVKEECRGQGIGKRLIARFEEDASKDDNMVFLLVADFNERAKKLYESLGYSEVGIMPNFYRKGVDEHLMMKCI